MHSASDRRFHDFTFSASFHFIVRRGRFGSGGVCRPSRCARPLSFCISRRDLDACTTSQERVLPIAVGSGLNHPADRVLPIAG